MKTTDIYGLPYIEADDLVSAAPAQFKTMAEGIETDSQIELLKQLGCDRLQGFKIGKPMPAEAFFANFNPKAVREKNITK